MSIFSLDDWCSYWSGQGCSSNSLFSLLFSLDCELPPAVCASSPIRWIAHSIWNTLTSRSENKQSIFPQSQETVLGKDFQSELVCATWKAAFSLAVIDSDSLNPSRSYPSHSVGSRVACVVDIPNPARPDVYNCTKSRRLRAGQGAWWKAASGVPFSSSAGFGSFGKGAWPEFAAPWTLTLKLPEWLPNLSCWRCL